MGIITEKGYLKHTLSRRMEFGRLAENVPDSYFDDLESRLLAWDRVAYDLTRNNKWALRMPKRKRIMICRWIWIVLMSLWLVRSCEAKLSPFYVKARNSEDLKINAFERCGRHYQIIAYEDDTALIECLE